MTTPIDLSRLSRPVVPGLILTVDELLAELLAWLADTHDWVVTRSGADPAWRLTRLFAGREALLRQAVADGLAQASLAYAGGENLDHIGVTYYSLERLAGEADEGYRQRLAGAIERYAVGLSGPWYESIARGVVGVADARVTTPAAGTVRIVILANESLSDPENVTPMHPNGAPLYPDGIPDAALLAAVTAVVTADDARQQTDTVQVAACTRQPYDVTVALTLFAGPDAALVQAEAEQGLRDAAARSARLGGGVSNALIAGATVDVDAVRSVAITLETIDINGAATAVDQIAPVDSVAPQARTLTVTTA